jgi:uncharacterized protein
MNVPELALRHQRLDQRAAHLRGQIERVRTALAGDPEVERLEREHAEADAVQRQLALRLRDHDRRVEERRARVQGRERELMSGRIRNPNELMKLSQEIDHLKATLSNEEDAELELMQQQEDQQAALGQLGRDLNAARERSTAAAPDLRARLERLETELVEAETERDATWASLPADWQEVYRRVGRRLADPVAEAARGQCQACRVGVTSSGMQALRRAALVQCDNCGRILVVV